MPTTLFLLVPSVAALLLLLSLGIFFFRRGFWSRFLVTLIGLGVASVLTYVLGKSLVLELVQVERYSVLISALSTAVLFPLIVLTAAIPLFLQAVAEIEDVLIIALDTDEWSDEWKVTTAAEGFDQLIADSSEIQREWLRQKRRGTSFLPFFAAVFLGEDRDQVAEYLQRHRKARYELLQLARAVEKQASRPILEPEDEVT